MPMEKPDENGVSESYQSDESQLAGRYQRMGRP